MDCDRACSDRVLRRTERPLRAARVGYYPGSGLAVAAAAATTAPLTDPRPCRVVVGLPSSRATPARYPAATGHVTGCAASSLRSGTSRAMPCVVGDVHRSTPCASASLAPSQAPSRGLLWTHTTFRCVVGAPTLSASSRLRRSLNPVPASASGLCHRTCLKPSSAPSPPALPPRKRGL